MPQADGTGSVPAYRLGVDVGGSKIYAVVIDPNGRVLARAKRRTKSHLGYDKVLERIRTTIDEVLDASQLALAGDILSFGIGLPGPVLPDQGILQGAVNLNWPRSAIVQDLSERCGGVQVTIGNDVNFGALGEISHGAALGTASCMALFMGTGLGAGLVIDGKIRNGLHGVAGEFGHIPCPMSQFHCDCGQFACLETVASKRGLQRLIRQQDRSHKRCLLSADEVDDLRSSALRRAWDEGCPVVSQALHQACAGLAWGLMVGGMTVDPDVYVLGGGVIEELGHDLLPIVQKELGQYSFYQRSTTPLIRLAQLGDDAVAIGAAVAGGQG